MSTATLNLVYKIESEGQILEVFRDSKGIRLVQRDPDNRFEALIDLDDDAAEYVRHALTEILK